MDEARNIAIFGSTGEIGRAFVRYYQKKESISNIFSFSRSKSSFLSHHITTSYFDITNESSIKESLAVVHSNMSFDLVVICTGLLHDLDLTPEKTILDCESQSMQHMFNVNVIGPLLIAKYVLPFMNQKKKSIFSFISARVGSIQDNRLGGWYSYRASKAALNMGIKTLSIESKKRYSKTVLLGLHPGTVQSSLSSPYLSQAKRVFTADESVSYLTQVLNQVSFEDSGSCFAWDGTKVPA